MSEADRRLASSVLNWYPFMAGDSILLINGEGALSDWLGAAVPDTRSVSLSELLCCGIDSAASGEEYDYIVLLDAELHLPKSRICEILTFLKTLLKPEGILLLGARNRFGIRYLSGGLDEAVREPMEGLDRSSKLYARSELLEIIRTAGYPRCRFYYLMPDRHFVQAVWTDEHLPDDSFRDRVFSYDRWQSPLLFHEDDLYGDLAREGTLPYLANYYLAEAGCSSDEAGRKPVYAALSTDRAAEGRFATVIYSDDSVEKKALAPESIRTLQTMCTNIEQLSAAGIRTVPHTLAGDRICMPRMHEEPLMEHLAGIVREGLHAHGQAPGMAKAKIFDIMDQLRTDILRSAKHIDPASEEAAHGPVLQTGYIDMIPLNAFWSDQGIIYYDQEFTVTDCPAAYILFRAIRYTWMHIPDIEKVLPLKEVQLHYGLLHLWEQFLEREEAFVSQNRDRVLMEQYWQWSAVDQKDIRTRRLSLLQRERGEAVDPAMQEVQRVQLDLLHVFDSVCRRYGLRYMAVHGTLLGAARHRGFIPWDDDVDVAMMSEDYEKLLQLAEADRSLFGKPYFLQTQRNDRQCYYGGYAKLRNSNTAAIEPINRNRKCNQGIWIDILPLDPCPRDEAACNKLMRQITLIQRIIYAKTYRLRSENTMPDVQGRQFVMYYILKKFVHVEKLFALHEKLRNKYTGSGMRAILTGYFGSRENRNLFPEEECLELTTLPFEDMMLPVPAAYDKWLRRRYGENYMELPPVRKRKAHKGVYFDTTRSWREIDLSE